MFKKLFLATIAGSLFLANSVLAQTAQITVTVRITQSISVSVTPGTYDFGDGSEGGTLQTAATHFTATNEGNSNEDLIITSANSTNWTLATTPAADAFSMNVTTDGGSNWNLIDPTNGASIATGLAPAGTQTFGLQILLPSSTSHGGAQESIQVTVTASAS